MSEPTYRVELQHDPSEISGLEWSARIYRISDGEQAFVTQWAGSREDAFDRAQGIVRRVAAGGESPSTVLLTEDGDILDPHEVQR